MHRATAVRVDVLPLTVTREGLQRAEVDLDVALRAARAGHWQEILPGAWLRSTGPVTHDHRQQAVLERLGPAAVLTGADACHEYGMRDVPADDRVCVLVPHTVQRDLGPGVRVVRSTVAASSYAMRGKRWVDPTRAVHDAALGQGLRQVRALVTAAADDAWTSAADLRELLERGPRRGSGFLRRAIGDVEAGARSAPEAEAADVLGAAVRARRLPPFLLNPDVYLHGELLLSPDVWLLGTGVGGELDSRRFHGSQLLLDATLARQARAERRGVALVHRSPTRFRQDPDGFVVELAERAAEVPEPPGLVLVPRGPVLPLPRRR